MVFIQNTLISRIYYKRAVEFVCFGFSDSCTCLMHKLILINALFCIYFWNHVSYMCIGVQSIEYESAPMIKHQGLAYKTPSARELQLTTTLIKGINTKINRVLCAMLVCTCIRGGCVSLCVLHHYWLRRSIIIRTFVVLNCIFMQTTDSLGLGQDYKRKTIT